ncbi:MAG TPA: DUF1287 domain-containing protein [Pseudobdellovibrionaceae bacterium]|nr:DUF1287 domain-containing protein [Pseudobdellovibrionaceae bacterium]
MTIHHGHALPKICRLGISILLVFLSAFTLCSCRLALGQETTYWSLNSSGHTRQPWRERCESLLKEVRQMTEQSIRYDPAYVRLSYPWGDPPADTGVCADLVVRGLRFIGRDLQQEVHEDLRANFSQYPQRWKLRRADPHIDHRRVPNLQRYFERSNRDRVLPRDVALQPCDLVIWDLGGGLSHIGWVSDRIASSGQLKILHHISGRPSEDDVLTSWPQLQRVRPALHVDSALTPKPSQRPHRAMVIRAQPPEAKIQDP